MSFVKKYLPNIKEVIEQIERSPDVYYMSNSKVDAFFGSEYAINLTSEFIEKYKENAESDFSELTRKYK